MIIHELTPADCVDVLSRTSLARLACCRMNQPYVVPISIAYDPRQVCLFGFSAIGRKVEWMRENPNVCLEVEDVEDRFNWTTVWCSAVTTRLAMQRSGKNCVSECSICLKTGRDGGFQAQPNRGRPTTTASWCTEST